MQAMQISHQKGYKISKAIIPKISISVMTEGRASNPPAKVILGSIGHARIAIGWTVAFQGITIKDRS